jgi:peptidoglycan/LPS O-acetylase OafA/YrhL
MILKKREDIQVLRAISVLLVLVFHIRRQILPNGFLGVDIFFIITGFVLYPQLCNLLGSEPGEFVNNFKSFLIRRLNRLMPAFLVCTLISLTLLILFASLSAHKKMSSQVLLSLLFLGNVGADKLSGDYFSPKPNPFLHYWSLSSEWQLYLFIPLTILVTQRILKAKLIRVSFYYLISSFTVFIFFSISLNSLSYYSPISRIWEFLLGMTFAQVVEKAKEIQVQWVLRVSRLIAFSGLILLISPLSLGTIFGQIVSGVFFISFILSKFSITFNARTILLWIGDRSYSIYLYHLPLIYLSLYSPLSASTFSFRILGTFFCIVIIFFLANWSFEHIEISPKDQRGQNLKGKLRIAENKIKLYVFTFCLTIALFYSSTTFYGSKNGARVEVAWGLFPLCVNSPKPCLVSKGESEGRILFTGDSHADHFLKVMMDVSKVLDVSVYRLSGPIEDYTQKHSWREAIEDLSPDVLVISQFNQNPKMANNFYNSLRSLQSNDIQILYLSDNPYFSDYLQYLHYVNPSLISLLLSNEPEMIVGINKLEKDSRKTPNAYLKIVKSLEVKYLDLNKYFCRAELCVRKLGEEFLFYDNHHLSIAGADIVKKDIIAILRQFFIRS